MDIIQKRNHGSTWTKNEFFDENGYFPVNSLCDASNLSYPPPEKRGLIHYSKKSPNVYTELDDDSMVPGCISTYFNPRYKGLHQKIKPFVEEVIGRKLHCTYFFDRFYFAGQKLPKHVDRDSCEISVTMHISSNLEGDYKEWPIWVRTPHVYEDEKKDKILKCGEDTSVILEPGDALIYKACEVMHWRDPLVVPIIGDQKKYYYHQIFFHYVLQDGIRSHHCGDMRGK